MTDTLGQMNTRQLSPKRPVDSKSVIGITRKAKKD